ncbi:MAG TPA: PrgI family protein [Candidatus Saccharibacteria bacterium]|nr:PrgI family protein [Candidatus Saccharibacteria bacterium]
MATHMVPQDVEAEDKLVGFLSLKQFIMTVLGIGFGYLTFFFFTKIHPLAALIWLPPTLVFFVLGLYQRKDQPIEVFLASALTFYFKPRKRKWDQEGHEDQVVITAPPVVEHHYTKDFTGSEAASRLQSLSTMMDSRGWASKRHADWQNPQLATAAESENRLVQPAEAPGQMAFQQNYMQPADVMDESSSLVARDFEHKIAQVDTSARSQAIQIMELAKSDASSAEEGIVLPPKHRNDIHQRVIQPLVDKSETETSAQSEQADLQVAAPANRAPQKTSAPKSVTNKATNGTPKEHVTEDGSVEISLH